ncbi:MAG: NTP transferase domain-containing protein [Acidobacteria bacterium]|nr:NTP transferase domain-containing protein [Acidobacteriota bacterium]
MADAAPLNNNFWSIILAGGEGERLRPLVQQWLGQPKPKQYCTFIGTRSMFQHTVDRADLLSSPDRRVTVIAKSHRHDALAQLADRVTGKIVVQPINRDTAAGVFLALAHVRARDPQATVVVYPSDHFVYPEERFVKVVETAIRAADLLTDHLVLLAVAPDRIEQEYGWIQPGVQLGCIGEHGLHKVDLFVEKPTPAVARQVMLSRGMWNTLILAARIETLWEMGWRCFPELIRLFEQYSAAIGTSKEETMLEAVYQKLPTRNFSSHLLQRLPQQAAAIEMSGVLWCDWGKPQRIVDTLQRIGKLPAFPLEYAVA